MHRFVVVAAMAAGWGMSGAALAGPEASVYVPSTAQAAASERPAAPSRSAPPPREAAPAREAQADETASPAAAAKSGPKDYKPVSFGKLAVRLAVGQPWMVAQAGMFCGASRTATWVGGQSDFHMPAAKETFHDEFTKAGLQVDGDPDNLFETTTTASDYVISGVATDLNERICTPNAVGSNAAMQKGEVRMTVEWQLYSRLQKQVLATVRTSGDYELKDPVSGGLSVMLNHVFAENLRQLADSPELRHALAGKALAEDELVKPDLQSPILLSGSVTAAPRGVDAEVNSVVLVRTGGGMGSGFLVSKDGYILTAGHVVGDATTVKIRWSDKKETDGQVVRVSKGRDVALIKTDARGREPLPLLRQDLPPSQTVFAVGAPWAQELQGSITRGVVSAVRTFHGYNYIQSDVSISPGNSGGPLLDDKGRVVGLTVQSLRIQGAPQGVNLFVPVNDAISFLSLAPQ